MNESTPAANGAAVSAEELCSFAAPYDADGVDTDAFLERVGPADRAGDRVGSYSKGMRQRLMVARSLGVVLSRRMTQQVAAA